MTGLSLQFLVWIFTYFYGVIPANAHSHNCYVPSIEEWNSEANHVEKIKWAPSDRLSWKDFKATPNEDWPHIAAITTSSILYKHFCKDGLLQIEVEAIFRKSESWVRKEAKTPHYLEHEQLHFDITELYARKLRAELDNLQFKCDEVSSFEATVNKILDRWRDMERGYDLETQFSLDKKSQKDWHQYVRNELLRYGAFNSQHYVMK